MPNTFVAARRVALLLVVVLVATGGCNKPEESAPASAAVPVNVVLPLQRTVTPYDEFIGRVEAVDSVDLRARVPGYLTKILVDDGATVKKDQPLFEIDVRPYQAQLDRAKAQKAQATAALAAAERQLKRMQELFPQGAATQLELENAMDAKDEAKLPIRARLATDEGFPHEGLLDFADVRVSPDGRYDAPT